MELSARSSAQREIPKDLDFSFKTTGKKTIKGGDNKEYVRISGSAKLGGQTYMVSILVPKDQLKKLDKAGLADKLARTALKTCEAFVLAEAKFGGGFTEVGLSKNQVSLKGSGYDAQNLKDLASMDKTQISQLRNAGIVQKCVDHLKLEFAKPAAPAPATPDAIKFNPEAPIRKPAQLTNDLFEKTKNFEKEVNTALSPPMDPSKSVDQNNTAGKEALAKFPAKAKEFKAQLIALKEEARANVQNNPEGTKFKEIIEKRITDLEVIAAHCDRILSLDKPEDTGKQIDVLNEVKEQLTEMAKPENIESLKLASNAAISKAALPTPLAAPKASDYVSNLKQKTEKFQEQLQKFESSPKDATAKSTLAGAAQEFKKELQTIHANVSTNIQEGLDPAGKKFKTAVNEQMHELTEVADTCINNTATNKRINSKKMLTTMKKLSADTTKLDSLATNAKVVVTKPAHLDRAQLTSIAAEIKPLFDQYNKIQNEGRLSNPNQLANFNGLEKLHDKLTGFKKEQGQIKTMMVQVKMWELEMAKNGGIDKPFLDVAKRKMSRAPTPLNSTEFMNGLLSAASQRLPPVPTRPAPPIPTSTNTPGGVDLTTPVGVGKTTESKLKESGVDIEAFIETFNAIQNEVMPPDGKKLSKESVKAKLSEKRIASIGTSVSIEDQLDTLGRLIPNNPIVKQIKEVLGEWKNEEFHKGMILNKNQFVQTQSDVISNPNDEASADIGNLIDEQKAVLENEYTKIEPELRKTLVAVLNTDIESMSEDQKDVQFEKVTAAFDRLVLLEDVDVPNVLIALTEKAAALSTENKTESNVPTPQAKAEFKQLNAELDKIMDSGFDKKISNMTEQQKIDTQMKILDIQEKLLDSKFDNITNEGMNFVEIRPSMMEILNGAYDKINAGGPSISSAVPSSSSQTNKSIENRNPLQRFDLQNLDPKDFKKIDDQIQHLTNQFSMFYRNGLKPTQEDKEIVAEFKTSLTNLKEGAKIDGMAINTMLYHANVFERDLANNEEVSPNEKLSLSSLPMRMQYEYHNQFETVMKERGIKTDYALRKEEANPSKNQGANPLNSTMRGQKTQTARVVNNPPTEKVNLRSLGNQAEVVKSKMEILQSYKSVELKNAFKTIFTNLMTRFEAPRDDENRALSPNDLKNLAKLSKDFKELEDALDNLALQAKSKKPSTAKAETPTKGSTALPEVKVNSQASTNGIEDIDSDQEFSSEFASIDDFKKAGVDIKEFTLLLNEIGSEIATSGKTEGHQYMLTGNLTNKAGAPEKNLMEQLAIIKELIPNNPTVQIMEESMNGWLKNEPSNTPIEIEISNFTNEVGNVQPEVKGNAIHRKNAKEVQSNVLNALKGGALRRNEAKVMSSKVREDLQNNFVQLKTRISQLATDYNALIQNKDGKIQHQPKAYVGKAQEKDLLKLSKELEKIKDDPVIKKMMESEEIKEDSDNSKKSNFTKFYKKVKLQLSILHNNRDAIGITDVKSNLIMDEMDAAIEVPVASETPVQQNPSVNLEEISNTPTWKKGDVGKEFKPSMNVLGSRNTTNNSDEAKLEEEDESLEQLFSNQEGRNFSEAADMRSEANSRAPELRENFQANYSAVRKQVGDLVVKYNQLLEKDDLTFERKKLPSRKRDELNEISEELKGLKENIDTNFKSNSFDNFYKKVQDQLKIVNSGRIAAVGINEVNADSIQKEMDAAIKPIVDQNP